MPIRGPDPTPIDTHGSAKLFVLAPKLVRITLLPLGLSDRFAFCLMQFVAKVFPFPQIAGGVTRDEPFVPLASQRTRLTLRERNTFPVTLGANGRDASLDFGIPLSKFLLSGMGSHTGTR